MCVIDSWQIHRYAESNPATKFVVEFVVTLADSSVSLRPLSTLKNPIELALFRHTPQLVSFHYCICLVC
jgi:hypothetical protein